MNAIPIPPADDEVVNKLLKREYWCFISYRHTDNKETGRQWATWLHQALETYEVPTDLVGTKNDRGDIIPERIFPVFRDEEELPVDAELSRPIESALRRSRFLVVLCSPQSVVSRWVSDEILRFKQLGKQDRVLAAIIKGHPNASDDPAKPGAHTECFPIPLRFEIGPDGQLSVTRTEPIAADFRLPDGNEGWTSPAAYREELKTSGLTDRQVSTKVDAYATHQNLMVLKIVAGILGVPLGLLTQRDKRYQLERQKLRTKVLRRWLALAGTLLVAAIVAGGVAYKNGVEVSVQRDIAETRRVESDKRKEEAEVKRNEAVKNLYLSQFTLAYRQFKEFDQSGARVTLEKCDESSRNWEWHWLHNRIVANSASISLGEPVADVAIISESTACVTTAGKLITLGLQDMRITDEIPFPPNSGSALTAKFVTRLPVQSRERPLDHLWVADLADRPLKWRKIDFGMGISCLSRPTATGLLAASVSGTNKEDKPKTLTRVWELASGELVQTKITDGPIDSDGETINLSLTGANLLKTPLRGGSGNYPGEFAVLNFDDGKSTAIEEADLATWVANTNLVAFSRDTGLYYRDLGTSAPEAQVRAHLADFYAPVHLIRTSNDNRQVLATDGAVLKTFDVMQATEKEAAHINAFSIFAGKEDSITTCDSLARFSASSGGIMSTSVVGTKFGTVQRVDDPNPKLRSNAVLPIPILTRYFSSINLTTGRVALLEFSETSPGGYNAADLDSANIWRLGQAVQSGLVEVVSAFPWLKAHPGPTATIPDTHVMQWWPDKNLAVVWRDKSDAGLSNEPKEADKNERLTEFVWTLEAPRFIEADKLVAVDTRSGKPPAWMEARFSEGYRLGCISPNGCLAALVRNDELLFADMNSGQSKKRFRLGDLLNSRLKACSNDGKLVVWQQEVNNSLWIVDDHPRRVCDFGSDYADFTFFNDGTRLVCSGRDTDLVDTATGSKLLNIASFGHSMLESGLSFDHAVVSSDASMILASGFRYKPTEVFLGGPSAFDAPEARDWLNDGNTDERVTRTIRKRRETEANLIAEGADHGEFATGQMGVLGAMFVNSESSSNQVVVSAVMPCMPAEFAGLRVGDILLSIDGNRAESSKSAVEVLRSRNSGTHVRLDLRRDGIDIAKYVLLAKRGDKLNRCNPIGYVWALEKSARSLAMNGETNAALGLSEAAKSVLQVLLKAKPTHKPWIDRLAAVEAMISR